MRIIEWLFGAVSAWVCWQQNTRPNRRDDPFTAEYKTLNRRSGSALLWAASAFMLMLLWAIIGPPTGEPPYRGVARLIQWTDWFFFGHWVLSTLWAALTTYQVLTFGSERHDEEE